MSHSARIGIDVGGTFTDLVLHDGARGITHAGKLLTTPDSPSRAIIDGLERLLRETDTPIADIGGIVHGTTLATNTLVERTGPPIGLLTTEGFRDVLEMGREIRFDIEDLHARGAPVLVPRRRRLGVGGRIAANGAEYDALDEAAVRAAVHRLVADEDVEALAVALLHAYANPAHELRVREIVRAAYPTLPVTLSAEVAPVIGEYERTTTACVNAYVQPVIRTHLRRLQDELTALGFRGELHMMLSGGGLTTVEHACDFPVKLLESGPAAGAIAASLLARQAREDHVLSFDMGGTTAKMCVIDGGSPARTHDFEAARTDTFRPGSGLPLRLTVVDMIEIGSGGGSIAAVDDLGLLTVGPRSAGSVPGPIAYGRGGRDPTVTDSDLVLGYLDPDTFLGGEMPLAVRDLEATVDRRLARPLGLDAKRAAAGIQDVVTESMAAATRMHFAEKGRDPSAYTLMAFGGAGPVHAYALAKRLKMRRIIVPMGAGVASALGLLIAAPAVDSVRSCPAPLDRVGWDEVNALLEAMETDARTLITAAAGDGAAVSLRRSADMRYVGQGSEIEVDLPAGPLRADQVGEIRAVFAETYRSTFGRTVDGAAPELVSVRTFAAGPPSGISLARRAEPTAARLGSRPIHFLEFGEIDTPVFDRHALEPATWLRGPAVICEPHTSCAFGPDCVIGVDDHRNLIAEISPPISPDIRGTEHGPGHAS